MFHHQILLVSIHTHHKQENHPVGGGDGGGDGDGGGGEGEGGGRVNNRCGNGSQHLL